MSRFYYYFIIFYLFSLKGITAYCVEHGFGLLYGNTQDFWSTVREIESNQNNIVELNRIIESQYAKNKIGLTHFQYGSLLPQEKVFEKEFPFFSFHFRGDALVGGEVTNPVFPKLKAFQAVTGEGGVGLIRPLVFSRDIEWGSSLGFHMGTGKLKTLEMSAPDFLGKLPVQEGALNFVTFDVAFGFTQLMFEHFRSTHQISGFPTYYHYQVAESKDEMGWRKNVWKLRWNYSGKWYLSTDEYASTHGFHFGVISTLGNYPLPQFNLLPKSWEYIQDRSLSNSFNKMSGIALFSQIYFGSEPLYLLDVQAGFYSGLFGGTAQLKLDWFYLEAGTLGLDTGVRYLIEETRLNYGKIGIIL